MSEQFQIEMESGFLSFPEKTFLQPLGFKELVESKCEGCEFVEIQAANAGINGHEVSSKTIKVPTGFVSGAYALVPGGWLPVPVAFPYRFIPDKNFVSDIESIYSDNPKLPRQWGGFLNTKDTVFNYIFYAMESSLQRLPVLDEFLSEYSFGIGKVSSTLPNSSHVAVDWDAVGDVFNKYSEMVKVSQIEIDFLVRVSPLVSQKIAFDKRQSILDCIKIIGADLGIEFNSILFVSVLSCLFCDKSGDKPSAGEKVIKPKKNYTEKNAYNAVSDIKFLQLLAEIQMRYGHEDYSFCTRDFGLALLWCALSIRPIKKSDGVLSFSFDYSENLFPGLDRAGLVGLKQSLAR